MHEPYSLLHAGCGAMNRWGFPLVLVLVAGAAWFAFAQLEDPVAAQGADTNPRLSVADKPGLPDAGTRRARQQQKTSPTELPPAGVPLTMSLQALRSRADDGDPVASCRLALEASLCTSRTAHAADLEGLAAANPQLESGVIATLAAEGTHNADIRSHCEGVGPLDIDVRNRLRVAAESGDVRVRVTYALFQNGQLARLHVPSGIHDTGAEIPVTQHYADHAVRYLEEGLQQHDVLALEGLILLHAPASLQRPVMLPIRQPDPHRFLLLLGMYRTLFPEAGMAHDVQKIADSLMRELTAEEKLRIDGEVAAALPSWRTRARPGPPGAGVLSPSDVDRLCDSRAAN